MITLMLLGQPELLIILFIILILFGSSKLPELARSMGQAKSEYKKGTVDGDEAIQQIEDQKAAAAAQAASPAPAAPAAPAEPAAPVAPAPVAPAPETPVEQPKQE